MKTYPYSPYFDDYDETKDYVQIVAAAGNYAQSREFTQIGTMFRDFMERLGNSIYSNGSILSGCDLVVSSSVVTLTPGSIYIDGLVRKIREPLSVAIAGKGEEIIGVKVVETLVTAIEDPTLRNPAVGTEGYNSEGASRVKQTVELTVGDPDACSIYKLVDGVIYTEVAPSTTENTQNLIYETLAKRTYDTSGNFKVEGLEITNKETDDETSQVYVGSGSAYIMGYNVILQNMRSVLCEIPTTYRTCNNEPKTYEEVTDKFYFNNNPLRQIKQITTHVRVTREITRSGTSGGRDLLPDTPVELIESVTMGSKTYTEGTDYQLIGNYVDWALFGDEPPLGTTYVVTYRYMRSNEQGVDYELNGSGEQQYIQFKPTSNNLPIVNTQILIDYEFYLSRIDTYCIDKDGEISVIKGIPETLNVIEPPINNDRTKMVLGTVLNYANSTRKKINNWHTTRLTQSDIYNLKRRIDDIEYNQAVKDLDNEAKEGEPATELKGILTDGFVGFTKADLTHPEYHCSIDLDMREMTLPFSTDVINLNIDKDASDTNAAIIGRVVTAPYKEVVACSQPKATTKFLVNPYAVYGKLALAELNPAVDNWIEEESIIIEGRKTVSASLRAWWFHRGESWAEDERQAWIALTGQDGTKSMGSVSGFNTSVSESVKTEAIAFMRERTVTVTGSNFEEDEDNIEVLFNGNKVALTSTSIAGATENTVKANALGRFTCKFDVPKNTPCGSVEVVLQGPISKATATYTAEGTKRTSTTRVLRTRIVVRSYDPLAQSFQFESDTILMSMDLFFAAKASKRSCVVQIRDMVNGYPGTTCYAEKTLNPEDITVNGDVPVATHITFPQPVYCNADTQYCLCILSDSNAYQVWCADMGETDVVTKQPVTSQPYTEGVMFSSSNNLTWTAHQMSDLTFTLYKAQYTGNGIVVFENVSALDFDRILLAAETEDHKNAGIEWWYKINGDTTWSTIETYVDRDTTEVGRTFDLRANIHVAQSTSPIIAGDCMNLVYFKNETEATYVSRQIELEEAFNNIKVDVQFCLPTGCTAKVYYMLPDKSEDWVQLDHPTVSKVDPEFDRYIYLASGLNAKAYRVKVVLTTVNPLLRPRCRKLMNILKY